MAASLAPSGVARASATPALSTTRVAERLFYLAMAVALVAAVFLGFARTFFLRAWFPEWAAAHGSPEAIFYVHGASFATWYVLLLTQASLVAARRVDVHRRLGTVGAVLAGVMVVLGIVVSIVAARRPKGFMDVPLPPLQFLVVPLFAIGLFAAFVALAIMRRRDLQAHKRYMLLASIGMAEAAIGRWPFAFVNGPSPIPLLDASAFVTDLFLLPLLAWDMITLKRVHPVTLWGGLVTIAAHALRMPVAATSSWLVFATWIVH
jgi:hypothetical protein